VFLPFHRPNIAPVVVAVVAVVGLLPQGTHQNACYQQQLLPLWTYKRVPLILSTCARHCADTTATAAAICCASPASACASHAQHLIAQGDYMLHDTVDTHLRHCLLAQQNLLAFCLCRVPTKQ
jgi:hypothetical protein